MNTKNFMNISELKQYMNESMKLSSDNIFIKYLSKIFMNLMQREENVNNTKSKRFSREQNSILFLQKDASVNNLVPDKLSQNDVNLSLNVFLDYLNIQEFIGQRIYKYLKKNKKSEKISKNDFCEGLNRLYYGNINDLINFTFFLADFNNDGKIYQTDMKIILAHIPCMTEFSQKKYLKQINKIINTFFEDKIKKDEIIYDENEQELNLEIFQKYIEEYNSNNNKEEKQDELNNEFIYDYDNNAPFFYFISIISYIFKNLPFDKSSVEYFAIKKNNNKKTRMDIEIRRSETMRSKKLMSTESKTIGLLKSLANTKANSFFKSSSSTTTKRYSVNHSNAIIKEALPKIGRTNLFAIKKCGSQIFLKKENVQKAISTTKINKNDIKNTSRTINKHEYILAKKKDLSNNNLPSVSILQQKDHAVENSMTLFRKSNIKSKKKLSPCNHENLSNITTKNSTLLFLNKSNSNDLKKNSINLRHKLPSISVNQKKYSPIIGAEFKFNYKEEIKNEMEEPEEFMLCEYSDNDDENRNSLFGRDSNKSENIFQLKEVYLFKYDENDFHTNILNKYYALIKGKEIIFFSSEQKTEFCDLWYINKSYISTGKESIGKNNYFTINITYENNFIKKLYFLKENICQSFSSSIKNAIKDYNFNDYYDLMNTVGEGHFGKVCRCKNKKEDEMYAVKIINKTKLSQNDLELIRQEKNLLSLIKHENIISLKDFFEDKQNIYFITEFYEGGDLLAYVDEKQKLGEPITEKNCAKIIRKIGQAISYLNFFGIIHRDLKPENIMFARPYNFKTLKLIDLGVCKRLSFGEKANEAIGTNGYVSPEMYLGKEYSFKIDVWALGVILYILITGGILPFDDHSSDNKILAKKVIYLQQEYPEEYFGKKSKRLVNLLDKMLDKNENKRINIHNLIKDCWFDVIRK